MATFKPGQRVLVVKDRDYTPCRKEGEVLRHAYGDSYSVQIFELNDWYNVPAGSMVPLVDPAADAFLEGIRKLKPLHEEPKVERAKSVEREGDCHAPE